MRGNLLWSAVIGALSVSLATNALATDGYQLIGIGQYAVGMAGAVVAAPDDPLSAAISNPAGLALLTPQAAFSAEIFNPTRSTNFGYGETGSSSNVYGIPAIGWVAPAFAKNWVFGGGVYGTSGLGVNYLQPNVTVPTPAPGTAYTGNTIQGFSSITFMELAPSVAWKVNDRLAVGGSLNLAAEQASFLQTFGGGTLTGPYAGYLEKTYNVPGQIPVSGLNLNSPSWAYGVGVTLGVLYKVNDMVTLGATYKSPIIFTPLTWQETAQQIPVTGGSQVTGGPGQYSAHLNYPQQVALGLAIRPIPQWLISVEGQWINWHATMNDFTIYGPWNGASYVQLPMHWSNQWVANIGTQYDINNWLQVRAGYTYGSNPISNADTGANLLFPAIVQNAVTVGATQKLGMGWKLTEAYMHEFSNTISGPSPFAAYGATMPASATLTENSYGIQIGYDF
jgi:long-chain fatty acid transport protein